METKTMVMKGLEEALLNGRLVGRPGSLRFRLARDTVGLMVKNGMCPYFPTNQIVKSAALTPTRRPLTSKGESV